MLVQEVMFLHEDADEVAIIGLGSGLTLSAVENFDIDYVDLFEINPSVVEANEFFSLENRNALDDDRVNLIINDARNYLFSSDKKYDVLISEPSNPWIEGEGYFFTKQFYEIVQERLKEDGIFTQWVGAYDFNPEDLKVLLNTLNSVFPYLQLWSDQHGTDFFIIAANKKFKIDYARAKSVFANKNIRSDFEKIGILTKRTTFPYVDLFFSFFIADNDILKKYVNTKIISTDNKPVIEFKTGKNRIKGTDNNLVALMKFISKDSSVVSIWPPVKNKVSEGSLDFLDIKTDLKPSRENYYFQYTYLGSGEKSVGTSPPVPASAFPFINNVFTPFLSVTITDP